MKSLVLLFALFVAINCHSTFYPIAERNKTCTTPQPVKIWSWHIHLLFFENNPGNKQGAIKVRDNFINQFKDVLHTELCPTLDHQNYNCMFDIEIGAAGPFPTSQWAVYLLPEYFTQMVTWMVQNREDYDILIHPNSGCEMEDHSDWAIFGGHPWELNMGAFSYDRPFPTPPYNITQEELKNHQEENLAKKPYLREFLNHKNDGTI